MDRSRLSPRRGLQISGGDGGEEFQSVCCGKDRGRLQYREYSAGARDEVFGDPLDRLWKTAFWVCGVETVVRETFSVVIVSTPEQRAEWLRRVEKVVEPASRLDVATIPLKQKILEVSRSALRKVKRAGEAGDLFNLVSAAPRFQALCQPLSGAGIGEAGRAHLDGGGACQQEFDGVFGRDDAAMPRMES